MSVETQPGQVAMMVKPSSLRQFASTAVSVGSAQAHISPGNQCRKWSAAHQDGRAQCLAQQWLAPCRYHMRAGAAHN